MLNTDSLIQESITMPAISTELTIKSGSGLVVKMENGEGKASNGTASTSEVFIGIAMTEYVQPQVGTRVEQVTAPAGGGSVTLGKSPIGAVTNMRIVNVDGSQDVNPVSTSASGAGVINLTGAVLTFNAADANKVYNVTYRYNLTVQEASYLWGDGVAHNPANAVTNTMSVIKRGNVYTDQFDTGADWYIDNITDICVLASGLFGRGANGAPTKLKVIRQPTADFPFLGLRID